MMIDKSFEIAQWQYDNYLPPEQVVVCECDVCGDDIYEGDDHYVIDGDVFHIDCIHDWARLFRKEAIYADL